MLKCAICGKVIQTDYYIMKEYTYKKNGVYACSWTCFNKICDLSAKELDRIRKGQKDDIDAALRDE